LENFIVIRYRLFLLLTTVILIIMTSNKLPNSLRKYIRKEKARIRNTSWNKEERKKLIDELYEKVLKKYKIKNGEK